MWLIRWLLVVPLAIGSVYAAVLLGMLLLRVSDLLCHALRLSDALCMVTWYPVAEIIVASVCGAFASLFAAILSALVAPSYKQAAAIAGTLVSLPIAVWILVVLAFPLFLPVLTSVLAALLAIRWVFRRYAAHRPYVSQTATLAGR
jgi:hypothetical protein